MHHIALPQGFQRQRLPFYLAMEEWVAANCACAEAFFTWRVNTTVICGRNQQIDCEVDLAYCRSRGIEVVRRKSGGGAIYSPPTNLMMSYVTDSKEGIEAIFAAYTGRMASALRSLGINAEATGRNDITIDGRKVSGNAFYRTPDGHSIAHGTLLYDTDFGEMSRAITPSRAKLESKGVKSVPARVALLKDHTDLTIDQISGALAHHLCSDIITLTEADIEGIRRIEASYYRPGWLEGRSRTGLSRRHSSRIPGVGEMVMDLAVDSGGYITSANLTGDFFPVADIDRLILEPLLGVKTDPDSVNRAVEAMEPADAVPGLTRSDLASMILAAARS